MTARAPASASESPPPHGGDSRHWASVRECGSALGPRIMLEAYRRFGRRAFSLLLYPVMAYFFLTNALARRASLDFLCRVAADPRSRTAMSGAAGWPQSFRHFLTFGDALLDKLAAWMGDIALSSVVYDNREIFAALERAGRGGVLIASHLGNMEVCRALGSLHHGLKMNVLVHTRHAETFSRLLRKVNPRSHVSLLQVRELGPDTIIALRERIRRGEFVVVTGDRTPVGSLQRISRVPYLGELASFPQGPFILAALLDCPVQLIFCVKRGRRYRISFESFADALVLPRLHREQALEEWVARYATRLEHHCLQDPYQWFNFYDFWAPPAAASAGRRDGVVRRPSAR